MPVYLFFISGPILNNDRFKVWTKENKLNGERVVLAAQGANKRLGRFQISNYLFLFPHTYLLFSILPLH